MLGPIDYVIFGFTDSKFDGSIMRELAKAARNNTIRVLDIVFVVKDEHGEVTEGEYADQPLELLEAFGGLEVASDTPLLTQQDVAKIGEQLEPKTAVAVLIIEHVWARDLKAAIAQAGGFVMADGRIHPEKVAEAVKELEETENTTLTK